MLSAPRPLARFSIPHAFTRHYLEGVQASSPSDETPPKRRKWLRRTGIVLVLLIAAGLGGGYFLYKNASAIPDFYSRARLTGQARLDAIANVERKFGNFQDAFGSAVADRDKAADEDVGPREPVMLTFNVDEIDAYFDKWLDDNDYRDNVENHLGDPRLTLHDGAIVMAGQLRSLNDTVVSFHFVPAPAASGGQGIQLKFEGAYAGNLPLPDSALNVFRDKARGPLQDKINEVRDEIALDDGNDVNKAGVDTAIDRQVLELLSEEPLRDLTLFPPLLARGPVAARVERLEVDDGRLSVAFLPLNLAERRALVESLKTPVAPAESEAE